MIFLTSKIILPLWLSLCNLFSPLFSIMTTVWWNKLEWHYLNLSKWRSSQYVFNLSSCGKSKPEFVKYPWMENMWYEYMNLIYLYCGKYILSKWSSSQYVLNLSSWGKPEFFQASSFQVQAWIFFQACFFLSYLSWVHTAMIFIFLNFFQACFFLNCLRWLDRIFE